MQMVLENSGWVVGVVLMIAAIFVFIGWRKGEKIKSDRITSLINSSDTVFFKIVNYGGEDFYCVDFNKEMKDPAVVNLKKFREMQSAVEMIQIEDTFR